MGPLPPDTLNAGISWTSLVRQKKSCEKLNSTALEVQITASRLPSHGDEQRKFTSPLILLCPEAGRRWALKAVFLFPPQRLSLPSLKLEGNPWGDPNPWNSSSCAFLLSQIINCHALYIHCTSNGKNSTKLPSVEYILPRNMNVLAVGWGSGVARCQGARSWLHAGSGAGPGTTVRRGRPSFTNPAVIGVSELSARGKSSLKENPH